MIVNNGGESGKKKSIIIATKYVEKNGNRYKYEYYFENGVRRMRLVLDEEANAKIHVASNQKKAIENPTSRNNLKPTPKKKIPDGIPQKENKIEENESSSFKAASASSYQTNSVQEASVAKVSKTASAPQPPPIAKTAIVSRKKANQTEVVKYEYLQGLKDLQIKHNQYDNKSIFVSKPMEIEGNVMQVSLESVEDHPVFDELSGKAASRQTSIEYYIAYSVNPSLDEWHPILPEGVKRIQSELIIFNSAKTGALRFPALIGSSPKAVAYKNGIKMKETHWSFADGGTTFQLLTDRDPTAIYTIDYNPNVEIYNPWVLDINEQGARKVKAIDTFENGTNHNKTIVLKKYPYIDYERINLTSNYDPNTNAYKPFKVRIKNASIAGPNQTTYKEVLPYIDEDQKVFTKNVTDYKENKMVQLKEYSIDESNGAYKGFEYRQEKNKLIFSETFNKPSIMTDTETLHQNQQFNHGYGEIEVEYECLVSNFRVKAILRRNASDENTLTPMLHQYGLKFKVMK
ncbi:structural protein [Bacillus phage vB_BauM_KLEB27-3]|nr:structural protein [Bacillus phage vB_BauM_KLEB27-3]